MNPFTHKHWNFIAYQEKNADGNYVEVVEITVIDFENEEDALNAVKATVIRPYYVLRKVWECSTCTAALRQNALLGKFLKDHGEET